MSEAPRITRLPNAAEIKKLVETIITPERADVEGKALIELLAAVSSPDLDAQFELAEIAMLHAFSFTMAHEEAMRAFAGGVMEGCLPEQEPIELASVVG